MDEVRPLRDVFDRLVAQEHGPAGGLVDPGLGSGLPGLIGAGHDDLDAALLADALVGYSDTAPVEVAEHLERFVTAVTNHQAPDPAIGLDLLATAPAVGSDALLGSTASDDTAFTEDVETVEPPAADLGFGTGTTEIVLPDASGVPDPDDVAGDAGVPGVTEPALLADDLAEPTPGPGDEEWLDLTALGDTAEPEDGPEDDVQPGE